MAVLADLEAGKITVEQANAELTLSSAGGRLTAKPSVKGGLSVYGLQRMPVTLYAEQWERLLDEADMIRDALKAHVAVLTRKAAKS